MQRLALILVTATCLSFFHAPIYAGSKLRSSISKEYANGMNAKLIYAVGERLGMEVDMKHVSFARRLVLMEQGRIDLCSGLHRTPEREKYIHFVEPPYATTSNKHFFVRKGSGVTITSYDDLYGLNIATSIGVRYFDKFDNDKLLKKARVSKSQQKFKMLALGRVDVVIHSYSGGYDIANRLGLGDQVEVAEFYYPAEKPTYFGISKRSPLMENLEDVEWAIREVIVSGAVDRIMKNHREQVKSQTSP